MSLPKDTPRTPSSPAKGGKKKRKEGNSRLKAARMKIEKPFQP
jgi:hypothetical protein